MIPFVTTARARRDACKAARRASAVSGISALIAGAALGAGLGLLLAPKAGKDTRAAVKARAEKSKETVAGKVAEIKEKVSDIIAKKKIERGEMCGCGDSCDCGEQCNCSEE